MKDKPFFKHIPTFRLSELAGKTLDIYKATDGPITIIVGRDTKTGVIYVLGEEKE